MNRRLDILEKRKTSFPFWDSKPNSFVIPYNVA
jgi:hypothetical protein